MNIFDLSKRELILFVLCCLWCMFGCGFTDMGYPQPMSGVGLKTPSDHLVAALIFGLPLGAVVGIYLTRFCRNPNTFGLCYTIAFLLCGSLGMAAIEGISSVIKETHLWGPAPAPPTATDWAACFFQCGLIGSALISVAYVVIEQLIGAFKGPKA
jgi:hypothetical protein